MQEITRLMNDMFGINDFFTKYDPFSDNSLSTTGFRKLIKRAHNLIEVKDKKGNLIAQKIEVVTTPFSKDDVRVTIKDNILTILCGAENKTTNDNETYVYHGISSQAFRFALSVPDTIDKKKITVKNNDGILSIIMPIKSEVKEEPKEIELEIQ